MTENRPTVPSPQNVENKLEEVNEEKSVKEEQEPTWKCGKAYQYTIPQPDGDPWEELLTFLMAEDRKRCKSLSEDIQLSLVVAALFSAVVVSLLIYYSPLTNADPQDEMVNLLIRLVTITENPANTTLSAVPLQSWDQISADFEGSFQILGAALEYLVCVWFSMAAVVMGISALQWLNAYETYPKATPKQKFALLSMRKVSFSTWRVPLLIKFLPVLLLASLYIFTVAFGGFQAWVLPINFLQILFGYMLTFGIFLLTVLPALEEYMLHFPRLNPFLRGRIQAAPCPYRSIQANIWRLIVNYSKITLYIFLPWACSLLFPLYVAVTTFKGSWASPVKLVFTAPKLDSPYRHSNWSELDWEWLMIRWTHFTELYDTYLQVELKPRDVTGLHFDERLLYDAIEGLIYVAEGQVTKPHVLYAAYHCFADLSRGSLGLRSRPQLANAIASPETIRNNRYIQALLANPTNRLPFHASSLSAAIADPTLQILHEENMLLFLQAIFTRGAARMTSEQSPNPIWPPAFSSTHLSIVSQHAAELHVRVKGHFYNDRLLGRSPLFSENHNLLPRHVDWSVVYFYQYVEDMEAKKVFTQKYLAMLTRILEECGREWQLELKMGALLTHSNLYHLILNGARATHYAAHDRDGYFSLEDLQGTVFAALRHGLILFLSQPIHTGTTEPGAGTQANTPGNNLDNRPRPDLLFYAACIYVQYLAEREAGDSSLMDALDDIIPILRSYRAQCPPNGLLERSLGVTFSPQWWSFLAAPLALENSGAKTGAKQKTTTMGRLFSRGLSTKRTTPVGSVRRGRLTKKFTGDSFEIRPGAGPSSANPQSGAAMSSSVQLDETNHGKAHTLNRKVVATEDSDEDEVDDEQGHLYPPGAQSMVGDAHGAGVRLLSSQEKDTSNSSRYNLV